LALKEGDDVTTLFEELPQRIKTKLSEETVLRVIEIFGARQNCFNAVKTVDYLYDHGYTSVQIVQVLKDAGISISESTHTSKHEPDPLMTEEIRSALGSLVDVTSSPSKRGKPTWLREIFNELNLEPSPYISAKFVEAYSNDGDYEAAIEMFKTLENPTYQAYIGYIKSLLALNQTEEAIGALYTIKKRKLGYSDTLIFTFLEYFIANGDLNKVWNMYELAKEAACLITDHHYHSLMIACGTAGRLDLAKKTI